MQINLLRGRARDYDDDIFKPPSVNFLLLVRLKLKLKVLIEVLILSKLKLKLIIKFSSVLD